ncbi:hypothetical protein FS749_003365 [Ceratobasidium sp. UAMH 11750]|nr:hypothetical protein FS749_003365 [Ceratobasidium sp. UAMH 11750]
MEKSYNVLQFWFKDMILKFADEFTVRHTLDFLSTYSGRATGGLIGLQGALERATPRQTSLPYPKPDLTLNLCNLLEVCLSLDSQASIKIKGIVMSRKTLLNGLRSSSEPSL